MLPEQKQLEKWIAAFKASPAKSSVVAGLAVIMVIAWVRVLAGGRTQPAAALALESTSASMPTMTVEAEMRAPRDIDDSPSPFGQWTRQPIKPLQRNPFAIALDNYPQDRKAIAAEPARRRSYSDEKSIGIMSEPGRDVNQARFDLDCTINLNATFIGAIGVSGKLSGRVVIDPGDSAMRGYVWTKITSQILAPATQPSSNGANPPSGESTSRLDSK